MSPIVGFPIYASEETPLTSASSVPSGFIVARLAPLTFTSALLTGKFERSNLLAPETDEERLFAVPLAVIVDAPDRPISARSIVDDDMRGLMYGLVEPAMSHNIDDQQS